MDMKADTNFRKYFSIDRSHVKRDLDDKLHDKYYESKLDDKGSTLVIGGASGVGKTQAAAALLYKHYLNNTTSSKKGKLVSITGDHRSLREITAECFGIGKTDEEFQRFFLHLEGKDSDLGTRRTWAQSAKVFASTIVGSCFGNTPTHDYSNVVGKYPPVIVLDNVRLDSEGFAESFLKFLSNLAYDHRVFLIIVPSKNETVDTITKFVFSGSSLESDDGWQWSAEHLTEMILLDSSISETLKQDKESSCPQFFDADGLLCQVKKKMKPSDALKLVKKEVRGGVHTHGSGPDLKHSGDKVKQSLEKSITGWGGLFC